MRIGMYCATDVGLEAARAVKQRGYSPTCVCIDAKGSETLNHEIRRLWPELPVFEVGRGLTPNILDELARLELDLIILAWWPYLVPQRLVRSARVGCLNFHPSLLPFNRGKHPNFWALVEGHPYGVSIHFVGDRIDGGDIAFQRSLGICWEDTGQSLHVGAKREIVDLFSENIDRIWHGDIPRHPQVLADGSFHLAREIDDASWVDLNATYTGREILNLLRARTYPPHAGVRFQDNADRYEVRIEIRKVTA